MAASRSYLELRWRSEHWRVYEVLLPAPFVVPERGSNLALEQLGSDRLLLRVRRPGTAIVRVRWTPYWFAHGGCVERAGAWTRVAAWRKGFLKLTTRFAPERVVSRGRRCDDSAGVPLAQTRRSAASGALNVVRVTPG